MPTLLLFIDLPASVPFIPKGLSSLGGWKNTSGTSAANLASLITGADVRQHGVVSEWETRPDGMLPRRSPRARLMSSPLWERLPNSLAVGWPWTSNSRPTHSIVISPDYLKTPVSTNSMPLPGQTTPWSFSTALEPLRITSEQLSSDVLKRAGYEDSTGTRNRLAEVLSAHSIASKLIQRGQVQSLAAVYLSFTMPPKQKGTVGKFINKIVEHYLEQCEGWDIYCVTRTRQNNERTSHDAIWGNMEKKHTEKGSSWIKTPIEFSQILASPFELLPSIQTHHVLPEEHWLELKNRYRTSRILRSDAIDINTRISQDVKNSLNVLGLLPDAHTKANMQSAFIN